MPVDYRRIRDRAKELGIKQREIAEALKIERCTVSQKLCGYRPLTLKEAEQLAELLQIPDTEFGRFFFNQSASLDDLIEVQLTITANSAEDESDIIRMCKEFMDGWNRSREHTGEQILEYDLLKITTCPRKQGIITAREWASRG